MWELVKKAHSRAHLAAVWVLTSPSGGSGAHCGLRHTHTPLYSENMSECLHRHSRLDALICVIERGLEISSIKVLLG